MLDQAYENGCDVALNELAEAFGGDVVMELVKIAKQKDMSSGEAAGMYGAGAPSVTRESIMVLAWFSVRS